MNIRFLVTFVWLCRLKNFNAVAEKLHTTQPSVSQRIATLEDHLKQKLYERGKKEFELTPAGRHLLPYAEKIVDLYNRMQKDIHIDDESNTIVRIGVIEMVTMSWLPEFVKQIKDCEPAATIDFTTETSAELVKALSMDELDMVYVWGPINEPNITNIHICTYPMAWLVNPEFYNCESVLDVVDLAKMPLIMNRPETSGYNIIMEYFNSYGIENIPESPQPVSLNCSYSLATSRQLVRTGLGIMALPPIIMANDISDGVVRELPVKQVVPPITLTACMKSSSSRSVLSRIVALSQQAVLDYSENIPSGFFQV